MKLLQVGDQVINLDQVTRVRRYTITDPATGVVTCQVVRVWFVDRQAVDFLHPAADALMALIQAQVATGATAILP